MYDTEKDLKIQQIYSMIGTLKHLVQSEQYDKIQYELDGIKVFVDSLQKEQKTYFQQDVEKQIKVELMSVEKLSKEELEYYDTSLKFGIK